MKKILLTLFLATFCLVAFSQVPQKINYQGVARNSSGQPMMNKQIAVKFSIKNGSASGAEVFSERHTLWTNNLGTFSAIIGYGTPIYGSFNTIAWNSGSKWLNVGVDQNGGTSYVDMGTFEMQSVPYALLAQNVINKNDADADPNNEIQQLSVSGNQLTISKGNTVTLPGGSTGATPGGVENSVQYKSGTSFAGDDMFTYNGAGDFTLSYPNAYASMNVKGGTNSGNNYEAQINLNERWKICDVAGTDKHFKIGPYGSSNTAKPLVIKNNTGYIDILGGSENGIQFLKANNLPRIGLYGSTGGKGGGYIEGNSIYELLLGIRNESTTNQKDMVEIGFNDPNYHVRPYSNGDITLGDASYKWKAVYAINGTIQTSDERDKTSIQDLNYGLKSILSLRPISYKWKEEKSRLGTGTNLGFSAQELQQVIPDAVVHNITTPEQREDAKIKGVVLPDDSYGVKYAEIIPVLVKAIQELEQIVSEQQKQIDELSKK